MRWKRWWKPSAVFMPSGGFSQSDIANKDEGFNGVFDGEGTVSFTVEDGSFYGENVTSKLVTSDRI